jgi:hypothetical protein
VQTEDVSAWQPELAFTSGTTRSRADNVTSGRPEA